LYFQLSPKHQKSVKKIQVSLKPDKNNGYLTWKPMYIFYHINLVLLRMKNVSHKYCSENKTHNLFPKNEPFMR